MLLRPRQQEFLDRTIEALSENDNTLGIAPTGAGKTILFSHILGHLMRKEPEKKALVVAHRDELTAQNSSKFQLINPDISASVVNAQTKDWSGQVVFTMVQTLSRETNLAKIPFLDFIVVDEAHHTPANTYQAIIEKAREVNTDCKLIGLTATPTRSDGVGLRKNYSNVADQIFISELVGSGHLVPPRTFIIDVAQDQLKAVKKVAGDFDMSHVEEILNKRPINQAVVAKWKELAEERQTVIFCSTVEHAQDVQSAFLEENIPTELIIGALSLSERSDALKRFYLGDSRVIVNVNVLTEGWDYPPTSCIVLLRPSSAKGTMIQMVGRGLRTVDPDEYPGVFKKDCIVLDFGTSSLLHGSLEQDVDLEGKVGTYADLTMECPSCGAEIPLSSRECPICGIELHEKGDQKQEEATKVSYVEMVEINLLERSHFQWVDLFVDDLSFYSGGFNAWAGVFCIGDDWIAIGGNEEITARLLLRSDRIQCFAAADDWLNRYETNDTAHRSRSWLQEQPTSRQLAALPPKYRLDFNLTRYRASALIGFSTNKTSIQQIAAGCQDTQV
ncbi:DEAD/DEAH box helicase [Alphaproteobacteria bacterium]|nr:DEAD/DEAH box helicase [Alphaproteobacteria bacterium]